MQRSLGSRHFGEDNKLKKLLLIGGGAVVAAVVVAALVWALVASLGGSGNGIDSSKYQAVFFTNGQVYFGKLHAFNDEYLKLTEVFYLQTQANQTSNTKDTETNALDQSKPTLVKLGDEVHGPEDAMIISKDQVLFYENLKSDGTVARSIEKYKNPN